MMLPHKHIFKLPNKTCLQCIRMDGANYTEEPQKNTFFSRANIRVFEMFFFFLKQQSSFDETTRKLFRAT